MKGWSKWELVDTLAWMHEWMDGWVRSCVDGFLCRLGWLAVCACAFGGMVEGRSALWEGGIGLGWMGWDSLVGGAVMYQGRHIRYGRRDRAGNMAVADTYR